MRILRRLSAWLDDVAEDLEARRAQPTVERLSTMTSRLLDRILDAEVRIQDLEDRHTAAHETCEQVDQVGRTNGGDS